MGFFKNRRRKILTVLGALLLLCLLLPLWAFYIEPNRLVVNETEIKLANWPAAFNPLRIAVISDLHAGAPYINAAKLDELVSLANQTNPDLIVLLGDFVSANEKEILLMEPETIAGKLKNLRARYGVYAVLGNHDWGYDGEHVMRALRSAGIRVLENEVAPIEKDRQTLWLLGVPDYWTRQPIDLRRAMGQINTNGPLIALTHNPDVFPELPENVTLTLAGHTHGGQVNFPFVGRLIVPSKYGQRFAAGLIVENGRPLFVTTGVGTTMWAVRFRVTPEIALVTITNQ